jgi:hypothetical protein
MGKAKRKKRTRGFEKVPAQKINLKKSEVTKTTYENIGYGEMRVQDLIAILSLCDPDAPISLQVEGMEGFGTIQCVQQHQGDPQSDFLGGHYRECEVTIHDWEPDWEEDFGETGIKIISRGGMNNIFVSTESIPPDEEAIMKSYLSIMNESSDS